MDKKHLILALMLFAAYIVGAKYPAIANRIGF